MVGLGASSKEDLETMKPEKTALLQSESLLVGKPLWTSTCNGPGQVEMSYPDAEVKLCLECTVIIQR